jgi:hypothetical protein
VTNKFHFVLSSDSMLFFAVSWQVLFEELPRVSVGNRCVGVETSYNFETVGSKGYLEGL